MKTAVTGLIIILMSMGAFHMSSPDSECTPSNIVDENRMLLVLSAPSIYNTYYDEDFEHIVAFQKQYVQTVLGNDNVIILVDKDTKPYYANLPADILLEATVEDIWMRDFSTVHPEKMIQFTYNPSYFESPEDAEYIQNSFVHLTKKHNLAYEQEDFILDGGNIVDNGRNKLVTTKRFLEENNLTMEEGKEVLKQAINVSEVAIIEYDDEVMGHADGMVLWTDEHTLLVHAYDEPFRSNVLSELRSTFSDVTIVEIPAKITKDSWRKFNSACGVSVNAVVTHNHIYVPTFNNPSADSAALNLIRSHTTKTVHAIPAETVCHMGGSVRCLSWQIEGENAKKLIEAARDN